MLSDSNTKSEEIEPRIHLMDTKYLNNELQYNDDRIMLENETIEEIYTSNINEMNF